MVPNNVIRYVVVSAAIYITSVYGLSQQSNDAFTLAGVAIVALLVSDHYAHYSWMKSQLFHPSAYIGAPLYAPPGLHSQIPPIIPASPDQYGDLMKHQQMIGGPQSPDPYYPQSMPEPPIRHIGARPASELYQYRQYMN